MTKLLQCHLLPVAAQDLLIMTTRMCCVLSVAYHQQVTQVLHGCWWVQVGRVEEVLHQLVDRETAKPGPSSSCSSSSAYVHAFSKSLTSWPGKEKKKKTMLLSVSKEKLMVNLSFPLDFLACLGCCS